MPLQLGPGQELIAQKDLVHVRRGPVTMAMHFRKRLGAGFFGGEGFIMQKLTGPGMASSWMCPARVVEYSLGQGQLLRVDPGHVAAFDRR
ncbi:MAG: AIM24 family protein [Anaerolineae bacterium]|nr:AIM24 family protein [Anaerolineae bacterium]